MKAEAINENSTLDGNVIIKTPVVLNIYITCGKTTIIEPKAEETSKKKISLDGKQNKGLFGRKYFIVIETKDFPENSKAKFKICFNSKTKVLSEKDTAIKVMHNDIDVDSVEIPFNNYFHY